jgi:hypothetical protein
MSAMLVVTRCYFQARTEPHAGFRITHQWSNSASMTTPLAGASGLALHSSWPSWAIAELALYLGE